MFWHTGILDVRGFAGCLNSRRVALLQYVHMSLIHRDREGKLPTTYVEGLEGVTALHMCWLPLGFVYLKYKLLATSHYAHWRYCDRPNLISTFVSPWPDQYWIHTQTPRCTTCSSCSPPLLLLCIDTLHHILCNMFHRHRDDGYRYTRTWICVPNRTECLT